MAAEAIAQAGNVVVQRIHHELATIEDTVEAVQTFVRAIAYHVEASGFSAGGPLTIVAMETVNSSQRLNLACREAYRLLQAAFHEKLIAGGYTEARAGILATFIISAIEGGIILSRVNHSGDPLRLVAQELGQFLLHASKE